MRDFARSDSPDVQRQLNRLGSLTVPEGRLGLETIRALLARLGDPHLRLPPAFHVAGTNGKGSTCAFLRAMLEAEGYKVHVTTSPHLVRYNERIRVAGELISDERLAELLAEVLDAGEDLNPSFFEVTIAAAFVEFARVPADVCVIEVGLGGRFDATNVLEKPAVCGIASLGIDHERFLLVPEVGTPEEPLARIAFEKAGIAKPDVPLVTLEYGPGQAAAIKAVAEAVGAPIYRRHEEWYSSQGLLYGDSRGDLTLPSPGLAGEHQIENAGLAIAMLRHQQVLAVSEQALALGVRSAVWPARLQRLEPGPLTALVPDQAIWLDGGHNPDAGARVADFFEDPVHLVLGMLANKNPSAITAALGDKVRSLTVVPVPDHESHQVTAFGPSARYAQGVEDALLSLPMDGYPVLITGSLYLAGEVLRLNGDLPD